METRNTRPVFPWYKERLQVKYLKAPTSRISSVGSCCLDDFSDGSSVLSGTQRGVSPVIFHGSPNHNSSQKPRKCISKEHACFSKQMIQKQVRREYVAAVEEKLKQHPLAMYPHYKDHMTPELFDKVVSVLDPDMCINSSSALPTPAGNHVEEDNNCTEPSREEVDRAKHATSANKMLTKTRVQMLENLQYWAVVTVAFKTFYHQLPPFKWITTTVSQVKTEIHPQTGRTASASEPNEVQTE